MLLSALSNRLTAKCRGSWFGSSTWYTPSSSVSLKLKLSPLSRFTEIDRPLGVCTVERLGRARSPQHDRPDPAATLAVPPTAAASAEVTAAR